MGSISWKSLESQEREIEVSKLKDYLNETDFYFIRKLDSGKPVPLDVKEKRIAIRNRLIELGL